jgi:dimethylaniline monooxygenase (N-oxide forming)
LNTKLTARQQLSRYNPDGSTFDTVQTLAFTLFHLFAATWFPNLFNWLLDKLILNISAKTYPNIPKSWCFSPAPSVSITAPLVADELYPLMERGFAVPVAAVENIVDPKTVVLNDGRILKDIDAIVYCTGYDFAVPFLPPEFNPYPEPGAVANLYRGTFPLHHDATVRNSLAFLGHAAVPFPGFVQHELLAMAVSQTWLGRSPLPAFPIMQRWHRDFLAWRADRQSRQKIRSTFYVAMMPYADHLRWADEAAGTGVFRYFGWSTPEAWALWWRDRELYRACMSGVFSPAIWRLFDVGKRRAWPGARDQVFCDNEILKRGIRARNEKVKGAREVNGVNGDAKKNA